MNGRNIHVKGHALLSGPLSSSNLSGYSPYRWECSCGAFSGILPKRGKTIAQLRREGHDEHKIEVLKSRGDWERDDA